MKINENRIFNIVRPAKYSFKNTHLETINGNLTEICYLYAETS